MKITKIKIVSRDRKWLLENEKTKGEFKHGVVAVKSKTRNQRNLVWGKAVKHWLIAPNAQTKKVYAEWTS